MRPIIIDTNAYAAFKRGDEEIIAILQHCEVIGISPIVVGELFSGFDYGHKAKQNRLELLQFLSSSRVKVFPVTLDTSNFYSQVYLGLKRKGQSIPTNDMWIAAQALENGCVICTFDKHFKHIENLRVAHTLAELII